MRHSNEVDCLQTRHVLQVLHSGAKTYGGGYFHLVIFPCERDCYIYENFVLVMFLIGSEEFSILDWLEKSLYHKEKLPNEGHPRMYISFIFLKLS